MSEETVESPPAKRSFRWRRILIRGGFGLMLFAGVLLIVSAMSPRPENLGPRNGQLTACPDTPNCVCSTADPSDKEHYVQPLPFESAVAEVVDKIRKVLADMPRTAIISETETYFHAECTSLIFRFRDDLEVLVDPENKLIHFRSASRIGVSDLGANRKRVNRLKKQIHGLLKVGRKLDF